MCDKLPQNQCQGSLKKEEKINKLNAFSAETTHLRKIVTEHFSKGEPDSSKFVTLVRELQKNCPHSLTVEMLNYHEGKVKRFCMVCFKEEEAVVESSKSPHFNELTRIPQCSFTDKPSFEKIYSTSKTQSLVDTLKFLSNFKRSQA